MRINYYLFIAFTIIFVRCSHHIEDGHHDHAESSHSVESKGADEDHDTHHHETEPEKLLLTAYSDAYEIFAEADAFVIGEKSKILAHFTNIPDFSPKNGGEVTFNLIVDGTVTSQKLDSPTRKGIYVFNIKPKTAGRGHIVFDIQTNEGLRKIKLDNIAVYNDKHDAIHGLETSNISAINTIGFTKEQSWKIDFATEMPIIEPMGQVIKTTAQIHSAPNDEILITSSSPGQVMLSSFGVLEGKEVKAGQLLFTVSGEVLLEDNSEVRFIEARSNFELASSNYERLNALFKEKIVSEKELQIAKNQYENAKAVYDNISTSFSASGQSVISPFNGYIKQLLVQNGQYVDVGQPVISLSQNKSLILHADVQQKYHAMLDDISSATIRTLYDNKTYTLDKLKGKIISYGRTTNNHNFLIPINLEIDYQKGFMPGSFVELYLKTTTNEKALTIPNQALLEDQGNFFVFVQLTPELFEMREVKIGVTDGLRTEIIKGLTSNERVVTNGAVHIKLARSTGSLDAHSGHVH